MRNTPSDRNYGILFFAIACAVTLAIGGVWVGMRMMDTGGDDAEQTATDTSVLPDKLVTPDTTTSDTGSDTDNQPVDTTPLATEETQPSATPTLEDTETDAGEPEVVEPKEVTVPTMDEMKDLLPEGGSLVRYWWSKMNDDEYNEVVIGYNQDSTAKLLTLGVKEYEYKVIWDEVIPGTRVVELEASDRNGDGTYEIVVWTAQGDGSGFVNIYQYSDEGPKVMVLSGGSHQGENTEIAYWKSDEALATSRVYEVQLGAVSDAGPDAISFITGPIEQDSEGKDQLYREIYVWDGEQYSFTDHELILRFTE